MSECGRGGERVVSGSILFCEKSSQLITTRWSRHTCPEESDSMFRTSHLLFAFSIFCLVVFKLLS